MPPAHHAGYVTMSPWHHVAMPPCQLCHTVTMSPCQHANYVTMPPCHGQAGFLLGDPIFLIMGCSGGSTWVGQRARLTLYDCILCMSASLRESRILSSMSTTTICTQRQQSMQKLCSSLHDSSDLHNAHRGIEAPTQKQNISTLCSICHGSEEYINAL